MTNRIKELAAQAGANFYEEKTRGGDCVEFMDYLCFDHEKFANLLIQDFIEIVEPCKCGCCHGEPEGIIADTIIKQTKQHFGVE